MSRDAKCREAARVIDLLARLREEQRVDVLCVGGLAVEGVAPHMQWGTQRSDELDLLIQHGDLRTFMDAMSQADYVLAEYDRELDKHVPLYPGYARDSIRRMPVSPEASYARRSCLGQSEPPELWINFHTTTRHGRLMLVDLAEWFEADGGRGEAEVMTNTGFARTIHRPPPWAMLLWQAAEVTCDAAEWAITRHDVDRLRAVAGHAGLFWPDVRAKAQEYDDEYHRRLGHAQNLLRDYQDYLGITIASDMDKAERQYGALYELSHALRAVRDDGGAVDSTVWAYLDPITRAQPRKIWGYPGVIHGDPVPSPAWAGGRLGIARDTFGIHEQIQDYPGADFDSLLDHGGLVDRLLIPAGPDKPTAPPHGPWAKCTEADMASMGLPA